MNWPALYPAENVVWRGKPVRSKYSRKDAKQTLIGIPVAIFITFWMSMALKIPKDGPRNVAGWLFPAFGMIFVLQALYLLIGHYFRNWFEWRNVEYAVTNRRTISRRGLWRPFEVSRPHSDSPIEVRTKNDGAVGDVIFRTQGGPRVNSFQRQLGSMFNPEARSGEFGLYAIDHPSDVYRIILAQSGASPKSEGATR
jgi:hypothetical protein